MKFTFEADMIRGMCCRCPILYFDDEGFEHCGLDRGITCLEVEPDECPLKEANEVVWHPYPKEKPTENKEYRVTVPVTPSSNGTLCLYYHNRRDCWASSSGKIFKGEVLAWTKLPEPYEEEE